MRGTAAAHVAGAWWRHHLHATAVHRAVARAAAEAGTDIPTVQELLGHRGLKTRMVWTRGLDRGPLGVVSRLDRLWR